MSKNNNEIAIKISGKIDSSFNSTVSAANKQMGKMMNNSRNVGKDFTTAGKSGTSFGTQVEKSLGGVQDLLVNAGIAVALKETASAFIDCAKAADKYETALAKVSTIADNSEISMSDIKNQISKLSQETGKSVADLSESTYQAISASVKTADAVSFTKDANKLAVAGYTETANAVDTLTTVLNAYGLEANQTSKISDMLLKTQNLGKTTVDELSQSLGQVIPIAAAYKTNMANVSAAYAQLTKNGIATANAGTGLKGMLNELGKTGSRVADTLQNKTGKSFAELMNSGKSLGDVIKILSGSVNGNSTDFRNLWSNSRAATTALSLFNSGANEFNDTLTAMQQSAGLTDEAYSKMTDTAEFAEQKFKNSAENLKIAIGENISPALEELYDKGSEVLEWLQEFVEQNPETVQNITVFVTAMGTVIAVVTAATTAVKIFNTVTKSLSGPIGWVTLALSALAGVATFVAAKIGKAKDAEDKLSATSENTRKELKKTQQEYDRACKQYGKNSVQATLLKSKVDKLKTSYDQNKQSVKELYQESDDFVKKLKETSKTCEDNMQVVEDEKESTRNLVTRLSQLGKQSKLTASDQSEMASIIDVLNEKMPSLGLTYDSVAKNISSSTDTIQKALNREFATKQYETAKENLNSLIEASSGKAEKLAKDKDQLDAAYKKMISAKSKFNAGLKDLEKGTNALDQNKNNQVSSLRGNLADRRNEYGKAYKTYTNAVIALDENEKEQAKALQKMTEAYAKSNNIAVNASNKLQQGVTAAAVSVESQMQELAKSYDKSYNSALTSFQGQYKLWNSVGKISATSTETIKNNLDSQISYWTNYTANIQNVSSRNIKGIKKLVASMDDGSEDSAKALAGMAGASDSELQQIVDKYKTLTKSQKTTAKSTAELDTNFSKKMANMKKTMQNTINKMDLSKKAKKKATATINAYAEAIAAGKDNVTASVETAMSGAKSILNVTNTNGSKNGNGEKNARGTRRSANVFLAGENGPELIVNAPDSHVFTAHETQELLDGKFRQGDNNATVSIDVPGMLKQLSELKLRSNNIKPSVSDKASNIVNSGTTNYNNSDNSSIIFSPTYEIHGSSSQKDIERANEISQADFEKMMKKYEKSKKRRSF